MAVSRSCYYEWLNSPQTEREKENKKLIEILKVLFVKGRGTYGTRRLKNKFVEQGIVVSRRRIGRLMNQAGLWCKSKKKFKATTDSKHNKPIVLWEQIDMQRHCAWIHGDQAKAGKDIAVPLNDNAISVIREQIGKHPTHVFTYKGNPILKANKRGWRNALKRAGIENFRWHDLRHTWASWHVQNGTPLNALQELGGWASK